MNFVIYSRYQCLAGVYLARVFSNPKVVSSLLFASSTAHKPSSFMHPHSPVLDVSNATGILFWNSKVLSWNVFLYQFQSFKSWIDFCKKWEIALILFHLWTSTLLIILFWKPDDGSYVDLFWGSLFVYFLLDLPIFVAVVLYHCYAVSVIMNQWYNLKLGIMIYPALIFCTALLWLCRHMCVCLYTYIHMNFMFFPLFLWRPMEFWWGVYWIFDTLFS